MCTRVHALLLITVTTPACRHLSAHFQRKQLREVKGRAQVTQLVNSRLDVRSQVCGPLFTPESLACGDSFSPPQGPSLGLCSIPRLGPIAGLTPWPLSGIWDSWCRLLSQRSTHSCLLLASAPSAGSCTPPPVTGIREWIEQEAVDDPKGSLWL